MKGLISGIKRMEVHDGDGLRTTVFLKGCPLQCIWCHNPESISFQKQIAFFEHQCMHCEICHDERTETAAKNCPTGALHIYGSEYHVDDLTEILLQDKLFYENSGGGVTLSGGECLSQPDFAIALSKNLYEHGVSVYLDTCGYVKRSVLEKIIPYVDMFLYDIKAIDSALHQKLTGKDNQIILENLKFLSQKGCSIEIRYPLVKNYNHQEANAIGEFLAPLQGITKVKVLQYHSFSASRYEALSMPNTLPDTKTTAQDLQTAIEILKSFGLHAVSGTEE